MILYKYTTTLGMKAVLQNSSLLVRPLDEYNDPFESVPALDSDSVWFVVSRHLDTESAQQRLANDPDISGGFFSVEQIKSMLGDESYRSGVIERLRQRARFTPMEFALQIQEHLSETLGLVCLSSDPRNLLMWSHYAEEHRGFVFAIDTSPWTVGTVRKVAYAERRVSFKSKEPTERQLARLVTRKAKEWKYEKEYRILCIESDWKMIDGQRRGFLSLVPEQIKWVCGGIRAEHNELARIERLIGDSVFRKAGVYRAQADNDCFRVNLPAECSL